MTEASATPTVEWDHTGRVIASRFASGHSCQFRYDASGTLYAFTYARLAWSTIDGVRWAAKDHNYDWALEAKVEAGLDGAIRIETPNVKRTLLLNGMIVDEFPDGTFIESTRPTPDAVPADLLAVSHERAFVNEPAVNATEAGAIPQAKDSSEEHKSTRRALGIAGSRLQRLRVVEEKISTEPKYDFVEETKSAMHNFVTATAVQLLEIAKGPNAPELIPFLDRLAITAHRERRVDEARVLHERALQIRKVVHGPEYSDTGINLHGLGKIYLEWGRYAEAEQALLDSVKVFEKGFRKARFLFSTGAVAEDFLLASLERMVQALHTLATLYHEHKKLTLCAQLYETAATACSSISSPRSDVLKALMESLAAMAVQAELEQQKSSGIQTVPARLRANLNT